MFRFQSRWCRTTKSGVAHGVGGVRVGAVAAQPPSTPRGPLGKSVQHRDCAHNIRYHLYSVSSHIRYYSCQIDFLPAHYWIDYDRYFQLYSKWKYPHLATTNGSNYNFGRDHASRHSVVILIECARVHQICKVFISYMCCSRISFLTKIYSIHCRHSVWP